MKGRSNINLNIFLLVPVNVLLISSSLSSVTSSLTLKMPAVFASPSIPPNSSTVYFENDIRTEKNDLMETLKPISMSAGVCREVNCGPAALPPNPCQNMPGTIFWPSSGQCVPLFCPPGGNAEIRGARLNSGLCDPAFLGGSEEDRQQGGEEEQQEKEVSSDENAPSIGEEIAPYLMGGILSRGPLDIPEAFNRPVVKPGPPSGYFPPTSSGAMPKYPPIGDTVISRVGSSGAGAVVGELAVVAIAGASLFLAGMTISAAYYGEDTPLDVADQYYGTHFADIYGWISGDY